MKIQSPRRRKTFASALLTVGVVGASLAAPAATVGAQASTACGTAPAGFNVVVSNGARITGTSGNDFICAGSGDNEILGGGGADIIFGRGGNDTIFAGAGADTVVGGSGDDVITGGNGADTLAGNDGRDRLIGSAGDDTLVGGQGADRLIGGRGDDVLTGSKGKDVLEGGNGQDVLNGNRGDDTLRGDGNPDILRGNDGNDTIDGGNGLNVAVGGNGNDQCFNAADEDTVCEIVDGVDLANPTQTIVATFPDGLTGQATVVGRNWNVDFNGEENLEIRIPGFLPFETTIRANGTWGPLGVSAAAAIGDDITAFNGSTRQVLETALESFNYNNRTQNLTVTGTPMQTIRVLVNNPAGNLIFLEQITFDASGNGSTNLSEVNNIGSIDISRQDSDGDIEFYSIFG